MGVTECDSRVVYERHGNPAISDDCLDGLHPCTRVSHSNTGSVETGESDRNPFHGSGLRTFQPGKTTVDRPKKIFKRNVYKYIIDTQLGEYRF